MNLEDYLKLEDYYSRWSIRLSKTKSVEELVKRKHELESKLDCSVKKHLTIISSGKTKTNRASHSRNTIGVYRDEINAINGAIEILTNPQHEI